MRSIIGRIATIGLVLLIAAGCSTSESSNLSRKDFVQSKLFDAPRIKPLAYGDTVELSVEVDGTMEVSLYRAKINNLGYVTLPLIGDVRVAGFRLNEARITIAQAYSEYYVNPPVIMLNLVGDDKVGEWGYVTVLGRVERPGRVAIQSADGIALSEAIHSAGGFAISAKQSDIRVTRPDRYGNKIQTTVNFEQIGLEGNAEADLILKGGDVIYVPERIF